MSEIRPRRGRLAPAAYIDGILRGDRVILARAITVIESELPADNALAQEILDSILPHSGKSHRVGITGVPGAGKSTFIDVLGMHLVRDLAQKVAVLSVDPSSQISGGSILGDKTRMERLSAEDAAFIRPSPARGHLGGVARRTRETVLLCEAAGYSNVFVETVGVGQSETAVRSMTDFFLLLMIPGAGDELQGIKRGIIEMLDGMVINKADGDNKLRAERARVEYSSALHLFPASPDGWIPRVLSCSSLHNQGIGDVWAMVLEHRAQQAENGHFANRRSGQNEDWMKELLSDGLTHLFQTNPEMQRRLPELQARVRAGETTPFSAASQLLSVFSGATKV
ncbi:MAG: methylmalonyl Co-A mutase-associated GTPase MeaB [Bryobacteraceae bacterium]|nr:methylmalonyl Co-A mutase-associated GTPase MeaB [Bryobacteraceae bacterium]